jgi:hypothetical protein
MQYNFISNNKIIIADKINFIQKELLIDVDVPFLFVGIMNDFLTNEPQYYYNKDVENEVFNNLNILYNQDNEIFIDAFYKYLYKFFHSINSYYNILDLYTEFDDVGFDDEIKTKAYYLPIITQLMEFCLNHFYRGISSITGDLKGKDYESQNTLGKLKNLLSKSYPKLLEIDIDFRDAISHGSIEINSDKITYSFAEKGTRELIYKEFKFYELDSIKNKLFDISSGALVGLFKFIIQNNIINEKNIFNIDERTTFEILKLFLHNENIKVKSFSKSIVGSSQFNIDLNIKDIDDTNKIIHILVLVAKIIFLVFPNYERYLISYKHQFSIEGMIRFENKQLQDIILDDNISNIDKIISKDSAPFIPDIQNTSTDNRSYKFYTFPKISGKNWKVILLRDISVEGIKRFEAKLIIDDKKISKKYIENLLFQVTKKIRILENKSNPITKIKYGKIEADLVRLIVFYKTNIRDSFSLLQNNENFICLTHYYKSKSVTRIQVPFQNNYIFEELKKFDIYWNKRFINANTK